MISRTVTTIALRKLLFLGLRSSQENTHDGQVHNVDFQSKRAESTDEKEGVSFGKFEHF